jgi:hypothetical protein
MWVKKKCQSDSVLDNAWQGYNAALFAYGQTGSGKSYSMIGYGPNKGIVPITCEELFKAVEQNTDTSRQLTLSDHRQTGLHCIPARHCLTHLSQGH